MLAQYLKQFGEVVAVKRRAPTGKQRAGRIGFGDVVFEDAAGGEHVGVDVERGGGV